MPITEEKSKTWTDKAVPHQKKLYPIPNDPEAPKMYPLFIGLGPRGSGKTFGVVKSVHQYQHKGIRDATTGKNRDQRAIIISPTVHDQAIFEALKADPEDIHTEYSDGLMEQIMHSIEVEKEKTLDYHKQKIRWKKLMKKGPRALTPEERMDIAARDFQAPEKPKYPNGPAITHLILDDLMGSGALTSTGASKLAQTLILNRHKGIVAYYCAQAMKSGVPKRIRENASNWMIWRQSRSGAEDELADEVGLPRDKFLELYNHALSTDNPHDFLNIDNRTAVKPIVRRSFANYLNHTSKDV